METQEKEKNPDTQTAIAAHLYHVKVLLTLLLLIFGFRNCLADATRKEDHGSLEGVENSLDGLTAKLNEIEQTSAQRAVSAELKNIREDLKEINRSIITHR